MACPFTGRKLLAVRAVNPDVTILHVQRADAAGNCHLWGASGFSRLAAQAARRVLITCEEIAPPETIRADPDRTAIPGALVDAVCEAPWGAHPAPVQGYYDLDGPFFMEYAAATRAEADAQAWLDKWVRGVADRAAYMNIVGPERWRPLQVTHSRPSPPVEYGW